MDDVVVRSWAAAAGIGFTVSLLVSDLSFDVEAQVVAAKTAVLVASAVSAVVGGLLLYHRGRARAVVSGGTGPGTPPEG